MKSPYIFIIVIFILCLYFIKTELGPTNYTINKAYLQKNDSISTMLDRIQWSNHHQGRLSLGIRYMFYSIIITFVVGIIFLNGLPRAFTFIRTTIMVWIILMFLHFYFSHHSDKFSSYAIDQNIETIREKLGYEKNNFKNMTNNLTKQERKFDGYEDCFSFFYQT